MSRQKNAAMVTAGILIGMTIAGPAAHAAAEYLKAYPSTNQFYLDREPVQMEAYAINGNNYVKLRDIGEAVGFNVYWDNENHCVQVESGKPYTGQPPLTTADLDTVRAEMVERINDVRMQHGAQFLRIDDRLMAAAQKCADSHYTWHHTQEECEAVANHGYPSGFGSNLTVFTGCGVEHVAAQAVENWVNSPGHLKTMVAPDADSIGVGVARDNGVTYCYMFVGKPGTVNPYAS